jgi:predicted RNase H-like nuclease (RuvC/YqgF family)
MDSKLAGNDGVKRGASTLRTALKNCLTNKHQQKRSDYLELFVIEKHLWRLNQEKSNLNRRVQQIDEEMATIEGTIARLKRAIDLEQQHRRVVLQGEKPSPAVPQMKTMTMGY